MDRLPALVAAGDVEAILDLSHDCANLEKLCTPEVIQLGIDCDIRILANLSRDRGNMWYRLGYKVMDAAVEAIKRDNARHGYIVMLNLAMDKAKHDRMFQSGVLDFAVLDTEDALGMVCNMCTSDHFPPVHVPAALAAGVRAAGQSGTRMSIIGLSLLANLAHTENTPEMIDAAVRATNETDFSSNDSSTRLMGAAVLKNLACNDANHRAHKSRGLCARWCRDRTTKL